MVLADQTEMLGLGILPGVRCAPGAVAPGVAAARGLPAGDTVVARGGTGIGWRNAVLHHPINSRASSAAQPIATQLVFFFGWTI